MAGGGYRGILAAVPTAQNLRSAFRRGRSRSKAKAKQQEPFPHDRSHAPRGNARRGRSAFRSRRALISDTALIHAQEGDKRIRVTKFPSLKRRQQARAGQKSYAFDFQAALQLTEQTGFFELIIDRLFDHRFKPLH